MSIPRHTQADLERYIENGEPVGGFLTAVLCNDLMKAAQMADEYNRPVLADIARYIAYYAPLAAYGDFKKMKAWIQMVPGDRTGIVTQCIAWKHRPL